MAALALCFQSQAWAKRGRGARFWMAWVVALGLSCLNLAAQAQQVSDVLNLTDTRAQVAAWPGVRILADKGGALGLADVMAAPGQFSVPTTAANTLGLRKEAVWLRIPIAVDAASNGQWVLDIDYAVLNRVEVYVTQDQRTVQQAVLGNLQPYSARPMASRSHAVALFLKPAADYVVYLRVNTTGAMIVPITFNKPLAFLPHALAEQMLQGILIGLSLCLLLSSLAQWASLRESLFGKYALLVAAGLWFSLLQFGVGAQFVWTDNVWLELHSAGLSALLASTGSFVFIEQALAGPDRHRYFGRAMKTGAGLTVFFAFIYALDFIDTHTVTAIVGTLGLAPALMGIPGAVSRMRKGDSVGGYFLAAWLVYFVTTALLIGVIKGQVAANFWTLHSFQFGALFDMLMFTRVLMLRSQELHKAAERAIVERDTLHLLAHADPLTGLPNRRELNNTLETWLQQATPDSILAVYMLDLDGFKQVNDQYGHDVGDELLIAVAQRLQGHLRSTDLVSRLGGDEFIVVSAGLGHVDQARELGQKLLDAFSHPFRLNEQVCSVGLTIGYALAPHDGRDGGSLLKRADAAMYAGKQDGKNCIHRGEASEGLT